MLKVLLISPSNLTTSSELLTIPIGLAYIKSYCESEFPCEIEIIHQINKKTIKYKKPDIVGISCFAATFGKAKSIARLCKELDTHVVVGGEQITTLPHKISPEMTVGVRGEGEYTFLELLKNFDNGWNVNALKKIKGLVFHDESGQLIITEDAPPLPDLDKLPIPDLLYGNKNSDILCLMSSRGCPYRCAYCATGYPIMSTGCHQREWLRPLSTICKSIRISEG